MTAKERLNKIEKQTAIVNNLEKEIRRLQANAKAVSSPNYSIGGGNTSESGGKYKLIDSSIDMLLKLFDAYEKENRIRFEIIGEIHQLDNAKYIKLLYKRYAEFKKFSVIAKEMNYDEDYVKVLHGKALKEFEKDHTKSHPDMCYNDTVKK